MRTRLPSPKPTQQEESAPARSKDVRAPRILLVALATTTLVKLWIASVTFGTNDVHYWIEFADGVRAYGPVDIYGHVFTAQYNHGPLVGWWLLSVNALVDLGLDPPFLIRTPAILADALTGWLIFQLLRTRAGVKVALVSAIGVVWSPVLLIISGFHGNTDPVFVALVLLALWLLTHRELPLWAGVAIGAAISIKLVPVAVLPWLMYVAWRRGRGDVTRFVTGGTLVAVALWLPVVLLRWTEFQSNVLSYRGIWLREWGIAEFAERAGQPAIEVWLAEHGTLAVLAATLVPFLWLRRPEEGATPGTGMALVAMLVLTPAFGMQYLAWPLAASYLVATRVAWLFNISASGLAIVVYSWWSDGPPWEWYEAAGKLFLPSHLIWMTVTWAMLFLVLLVGMHRAIRSSAAPSRVSTSEG